MELLVPGKHTYPGGQGPVQLIDVSPLVFPNLPAGQGLQPPEAVVLEYVPGLHSAQGPNPEPKRPMGHGTATMEELDPAGHS